ncbi:MAG: hypothetical protein ACXVH3_36305 [Solirubrobacteraceae bacterium]
MTECERNRYAVAAVHDVIAVRSREQANRGQRITFAVRQRYPFPPVPPEFGGGTEAGVELRGGFQRADDRAQRDDFKVRYAPNLRGHVCECRWTAAMPSSRERPIRAAAWARRARR